MQQQAFIYEVPLDPVEISLESMHVCINIYTQNMYTHTYKMQCAHTLVYIV